VKPKRREANERWGGRGGVHERVKKRRRRGRKKTVVERRGEREF